MKMTENALERHQRRRLRNKAVYEATFEDLPDQKEFGVSAVAAPQL